MATFEGRLAFARMLRRYGSRELGREAGLSAAAVSKLERPCADPKLSTVTLLARVLQCDPAWLAWGVGTAPVETDADRQRMPPTNARRWQFIPVRRVSPRQALSRRRARQGAKGGR
jgi:transcriptional regulator with XRE-family HTH domain